MMRLTIAAAALIAFAGAAQAEDGGNRYGYDQITAKNLKAAEQRLLDQQAAEPNEPSVLLNLAYVYKKTGRTAEADALYERVLAQKDVLMALGNGKPAWSHTLAMKAMGRSTDYAGR